MVWYGQRPVQEEKNSGLDLIWRTAARSDGRWLDLDLTDGGAIASVGKKKVGGAGVSREEEEEEDAEEERMRGRRRTSVKEEEKKKKKIEFFILSEKQNEKQNEKHQKVVLEIFHF